MQKHGRVLQQGYRSASRPNAEATPVSPTTPEPDPGYHWPNLSAFGALLSKVEDTHEPPAELLTKILCLVLSAQGGAVLCVGQDEGHTIAATTGGFLAAVVLPRKAA